MRTQNSGKILTVFRTAFILLIISAFTLLFASCGQNNGEPAVTDSNDTTEITTEAEIEAATIPETVPETEPETEPATDPETEPVETEPVPVFEGKEMKQQYSYTIGNALYSYDNATQDDYQSYCDTLLQNGYEVCFENSINDNVFTGFEKYGKLLYAYYVGNRSMIRVIDDQVSPIPEYSETPAEYEKVTEMKVAQITPAYNEGNFGMCYIITLEDGRFVIIDSLANVGTDEDGYDDTRIYNYLETFNEHPSGKIVIAAWIITHNHMDHTGGFIGFSHKYNSKVTLERFLINSVSFDNSTLSKGLAELLSLYKNDVELIYPHTGQKMSFCNTEFEFLYTYDELYPLLSSQVELNDTSLLFRVTANGQTILFPGDIQEVACDIICPMYGNYLKSDIVQVSHHGYAPAAATSEFYDFVDPAVLLWPHNISCFDGWRVSDVNRHLLRELNVKEILVADLTTKVLTIPYTPCENNAAEYIIRGIDTDEEITVVPDDEKGQAVFFPKDLSWDD